MDAVPGRVAGSLLPALLGDLTECDRVGKAVASRGVVAHVNTLCPRPPTLPGRAQSTD
jgi:hypothetical protein